jgi:hypothetical protein
MEDLERKCDEATKDLANKRKVLQTAGFKLESQEEDLEHAKKIKRVEAWADKHGGIDRLQKLLNFQDKRIKYEYQSMLAGLSLSPQDVVAVKFAHPKEHTVFGVVLAEPDLSAPYEVRLKLCGEKTDTVACAPARAQIYEVLSSRNAEDLLTRVATATNLDVVYEVTGSQRDKSAFRYMYMATSMANIVKSPSCQSMRGQLLNWAKHMKDRLGGGNAREERRANAVEVEAEEAPAAAPAVTARGHAARISSDEAKKRAEKPLFEKSGVVAVKIPPHINVGETHYAMVSNGTCYSFIVPRGLDAGRLVAIKLPQ